MRGSGRERVDGSALRCGDPAGFAPPYRGWDGSIAQVEARAARRIDDAVRTARASGGLGGVAEEWLAFLRAEVQVAAFMARATAKVLDRAGARCPWPAVADGLHHASLTHERQAVALVLHASDLEHVAGPMPVEDARERWHRAAGWAATRDVLRRLAEVDDWAEALTVTHLAVEPLVGVLLRRELGVAVASAFGDPVTPALAEAGQLEYDWACDWTLALLRFLFADPAHGAANRELVDRWLRDWAPRVDAAAADAAGLGRHLVPSYRHEVALGRVREEQARLLTDAGLEGVAC